MSVVELKPFRKDDTGKRQWSLLPFDSAEEIIKALEFGAARYGADNWCAGADWSRYFNACMRHLIAWQRGEQADPDSGLSHLAHAGACLHFLLAYDLRGIGRDDRPPA